MELATEEIKRHWQILINHLNVFSTMIQQQVKEKLQAKKE